MSNFCLAEVSCPKSHGESVLELEFKRKPIGSTAWPLKCYPPPTQILIFHKVPAYVITLHKAFPDYFS